MEFDFLEPISEQLVAFRASLSAQQLGSKIAVHTHKEFPDLENCEIALVGVLEKRDENGLVQNFDLTTLRKKLYSLFPGNWHEQLADLGDILAGNSKEDTLFAVTKINEKLHKLNIIPIVLGCPHDLTYAMYRAYDNLEQMVNLVVVDNKFDIGTADAAMSSSSYLSKIIINEPTNLFNYSNIGYQTYYNPQEEIDLIEKLNFDAYRLGEISANIALAEPVLRDADLVSIDMSSLQSTIATNYDAFEPNGFSGKEICALARYAGISDKVTAFGIFNFNASLSDSSTIAQIIWYFIEGVNCRWNDYPFGTKENYIKFTVTTETDDIVFFQSNTSNRWWMAIPFFANANNKLKKITLLPCSHQDYLSTCNNELPERWWKAQQKNAI